MAENPARVRAFVAAIAVTSALVTLTSLDSAMPYPGTWVIACFVVVAFLLDQSSTNLRVSATGSTSFVIHMAAGILFGGTWGGLVAGVSTVLTMVVKRSAAVKVIFNCAQRVLSVVLAFTLYTRLGGTIPPAYLRSVSGGTPESVQIDVVLFFGAASIYFLINSFAVSGAIALDSGRRFREVWHLNTRGVLGYDLGASVISILVAVLYVQLQGRWGIGPVGLVGVILPIIAVRHVYGLYHRLQDSGRELLDLMVKAIEARDPYTSGHSIRVATLAKAIAQEAGMSSAAVEEVYTAALLHDVGKIHEEFAPLLRKESKLTAEETALLQTHAQKSADLVGIISSFRGSVQDAVRSHHERWDGTGYPDGLATHVIPMGARIIMISDTTDAMTTDRPYRKKLSLETVVAELQKYKGSQFDPSLVELTINSVAVRRVIAELQNSTSESPVTTLRQGGSTRVRWRDSGIWKARRAY